MKFQLIHKALFIFPIRSGFFLGALILLLHFPQLASAQQSPSGAIQSPATAAAQPVIAGGAVRVMNTFLFRSGINELKVKVDLLNKEFDASNREITTLQDQITALQTEIQNQGGALSQATLAEKNNRLTETKRKYDRLVEDVQVQANRRWNEETGPIYKKVETFMAKFCQERGIVVVFDLAGSADKNLIQYVAAGADITQEFMDAYNKTNVAPGIPPAPASASKRP